MGAGGRPRCGARGWLPVRPLAYRWRAVTLRLEDPLAHRALEALMRAETHLSRELGAALEREGLSASGFSVLVVLDTAGGALELRRLRLRLGMSKANATEVTRTLESRALVRRERIAGDRRSTMVSLTQAGREAVDRLFPGHAERVREAFAALDPEEKRSLTALCRKLAA